jgi:hypothetical protein
VNLFFPIVYIILTTAITILPMIAKPVETSIGMGMILTALPVYWFFIAWTNKPACIAKYTNHVTLAIQKLIMAVPSSD